MPIETIETFLNKRTNMLPQIILHLLNVGLQLLGLGPENLEAGISARLKGFSTTPFKFL